MTPSTGELPEVREAEAPADVAALYHRIRRAAGIPQVNLIYRHLATLPGVLAWSWHVLEPHYASGRLDRAADRLRSRMAAELLPPIWSSLDDEAASELSRVLSFYSRANALNAIALTALGQGLTTVVPPRQGDVGADTTGREAATALVTLPKLSELSEDERRQVRALATLHPEGEAGVTPSVYLHLALWPAVLSLSYDRLKSYVGSAAWRDRKQALMAGVAREADAVFSELTASEPPPGANARARALASIRMFVNGTIPDMLLVGTCLSGDERSAWRRDRSSRDV